MEYLLMVHDFMLTGNPLIVMAKCFCVAVIGTLVILYAKNASNNLKEQEKVIKSMSTESL